MCGQIPHQRKKNIMQNIYSFYIIVLVVGIGTSSIHEKQPISRNATSFLNCKCEPHTHTDTSIMQLSNEKFQRIHFPGLSLHAKNIQL